MAVAIVAFTRMERLFMSELTQDEIIEMARKIATEASKVGPYRAWTHEYAMSRIMQLVDASAAKERERLAQEASECGGVLTVGAILSKG